MRKIRIILIFIIVILSGVFLQYSYNHFVINEKFTALPLSFNPDTCESTYQWGDAQVKIKGGFVKGKIIDNNREHLILRSLTPTPVITIKGSPSKDTIYNIRLENINPINTTIKNVDEKNRVIIDPHTILMNLDIKKNELKTIAIQPKENNEYFEFVILGDNRNGYQTFSQIIQQINSISPAFVIDNGDLVFSGDPNKYRLFYEIVSQFQVPLYTTLGNHDIRKNGREIYNKLFGPDYYSFDYKNIHFVFLDSSRGWAEKTSIPEEQYKWLERDLKNAQGKKIFVISHIPSTDPRTYKNPNELPELPGVEKTSYFEKLMDNYNQYKSINHGFPDREEAEKFEGLMKKYNVDIVFLSHIHSYFSYVKNDVRYIISGGAGAELLTTNSYYHYMRVKVTDKDSFLEMVQLPSPTNKIQDRYIAAINLFAKSIYKEYKSIVVIIFTTLSAFLIWSLYTTRNKWIPALNLTRELTKRVFVYAKHEYRDLKKSNYKF